MGMSNVSGNPGFHYKLPNCMLEGMNWLGLYPGIKCSLAMQLLMI